MMLNCLQASRLMSLAQDRSLTTAEVVKLRFHLAMCGKCRNFNHHLKVIRLGAKASVSRPD